MKTKNLNQPTELNRLGLCIEVSFLKPTNSRPARWKASIKDLRDSKEFKAISPFTYGSPYYGDAYSDDGQRATAQKVLDLFNARGEIGNPFPACKIMSQGYFNGCYLFFC